MARAKQSMDGNTAAAHVAYAYTEEQVSILSHLPARWQILLISGLQQDRRTSLETQLKW